VSFSSQDSGWVSSDDDPPDDESSESPLLEQPGINAVIMPTSISVASNFLDNSSVFVIFVFLQVSLTVGKLIPCAFGKHDLDQSIQINFC
jgi:hypothetical protein